MSAHEEDEQRKFERTLKHASEGYSNARETIKFLDSKTNVIVGLLIVTTAMPLTLLKWSAGIDKDIPAKYDIFSRSHPYTALVCQFSTVIAAILGAFGVYFATQSLKARSPSEWFEKFRGRKNGTVSASSNSGVTILFPYYEPNQKEHAAAVFGSILNTLSQRRILSDYQHQLIEVGRILHAKVHYNKRAVTSLQFQLLVYVVAFLASLILSILGF